MKKAVVIGVHADMGLGGQLCRRFAKLGLEVYIAGRTKKAIDKIATDIKKGGGKAVAVPTDATVNASIPLPENSIEYVRVLSLVVMEIVTLVIVVSASKAL